MSRYGGGDYPPRGGPTERWDSDRFARERSGRTTVIEKDRFEERDRYAAPPSTRRRESSADHFFSSRPAPPRGGGYEEEEDRFYERRERFEPPARREPRVSARDVRQRRYYEEDDYEEDDPGPRRFAGRGSGGGGGGRNEPRPGMLVRRQSSLDTFDRKPMRYREPEAPRYREPEVITVPPPRGGRGREEKHRYEPRYAERDYEEMDIRIAEPDRYGDDRFRGWKEREVETIRRRRGGRSRSEERGGGFREREEEREEVVIEEEKPWPRRGRTRMSARLVNKRALVQLGYPYEDELTDEGDFVIVLKALNKELIDEVLGLSKEFNARMTAAYAIEAPAPEREVIERREIVIPEPGEVPRSVRDWDVMSGSLGGGKSQHGGRSEHGGKSEHGGRSEHGGGHSVAASHKSHKSHKSKHSTHRSRSAHHSEHRSSHRSSSSGSTVKGGHSRSPSPVLVVRSKSRHRSRSSAGHKVKKEEIDLVEEEEIGDSNAMHVGPLALVLPHHDKKRSNSKDERKIKEEIRELEEEKRRLKRERKEKKHYHRGSDEDEVIIERVHSGGHSHSRRRDDEEIVIERGHGGGHGRRREEEVKIEKDRKGNMAFVK